jgi:hypothetical protein
MAVAYKVYADVTTEPITLIQAKDYLNIVSTCTEFDTLITAMIPAVRQKIEGATNIKMGAATIDCIFDDTEPEMFIEIGNVATVDSVKYYDTANQLQTWAAENYEYQLNSAPVLFRAAYNVTYPNLRDRYDAFTIRVTTSATYPKPLIQALYMTLGHWFENRQDVVVGHSVNEMPLASAHICKMYGLTIFR